jgi:hypothetical protein
MRTPRWPTLTPPPPFREMHEFKLPIAPTFLCEETADQEEKRRRFVRQEAFRFYKRVVEHLGEEDTKKLYSVFCSNPRRGSPGGSADLELKEWLLAEYDKRCANALRHKSNGAKNVRARVAHDLAPEFGKKPAALRKALDRCLIERAEHIEKQRRRQALWEARHRPRPKSPATPMEVCSSEDSDTKSEK